jgi:hypothetical protein
VATEKIRAMVKTWATVMARIPTEKIMAMGKMAGRDMDEVRIRIRKRAA